MNPQSTPEKQSLGPHFLAMLEDYFLCWNGWSWKHMDLEITLNGFHKKCTMKMKIDRMTISIPDSRGKAVPSTMLQWVYMTQEFFN